jgi:hypothetical protein
MLVAAMVLSEPVSAFADEKSAGGQSGAAQDTASVQSGTTEGSAGTGAQSETGEQTASSEAGNGSAEGSAGAEVQSGTGEGAAGAGTQTTEGTSSGENTAGTGNVSEEQPVQEPVTEGTGSEEQTLEIIIPEEEATGARLITGFRGLSGQQRTLTFYRDEKPSYEELLSRLPGELGIYTEAGEENIPVNWFCVGDDFDNPNAIYFQFSPVWDEAYYRVSDGFDVIRNAPYIEVFILEREQLIVPGNTSTNASEETSAQPPQVPGKVVLSYDQSTNKGKIFTFLTGNMGLNMAAACGVIANIYCESGFNPNALGDKGTSYGICQWHNSRYHNLKVYCKRNGYDYTTLEGQLHFLEHELNNSYAATLKLLTSLDNDAEAAYYAGYSWCYNFEKPKNYPSVSVTRGHLARDKYWAAYTGEDTSGFVEPEIRPGTTDNTGKATQELSGKENSESMEEPENGEALPDASEGEESGTGDKADEITVLSAELSQKEMYLIAGGRGVKLKTSVQTEEGTECAVSWESSDKDVAYVSNDGFVLPKTEGEAVIKAVLEEGTELFCMVFVRENDTSDIIPAEQIEYRSLPGGPVKIGRYESYAGVSLSYRNAVTYTGKKILPERDLEANVDISELTAIVDELGLIRKEGTASEELFEVSYISDGILTGDASFGVELKFDKKKARRAGLKRREIAELEFVCEEIGDSLKQESFGYHINPMDISSNELTVRVKLNNKDIMLENHEISNIRSVKLSDEKHNIYEIGIDKCDIKVMDMEGVVILNVTGDDRFTGLRAAEVFRPE